MKLKKVVQINQALHGYSDGHKLLDATINLSKESERIMLIMSDMSGQSMVRGFESYITGYPLQNEGLYAIARTWYAPEMKRPGCVWTHTLLVDFKDLGAIDNAFNILSLFARPSSTNENRITYKSKLDISPIDMSSGSLDNMVSLEIAAPLIKALYFSDERPVVVPAVESRQYEALIMAIWNQQWPLLRKSFYFCTGAIANRKIDSKIFDLQVVPFTSLNDIRRELPSAIFIDTDKDSEQLNMPDWVIWAVNNLDLDNDVEGWFRTFLWQFADDVKGGRSSFERLARTFLDIEKVKSNQLCLNDLTDTFSKNFPTAQDANGLKTAIYGGEDRERSNFLPSFNEAELLRELVTTNHYQIFDFKALNVRQRAKELWKNDRAGAKELVFLIMRNSLNVLGEEFLKGLSEGFELSEIREFTENKNALIYVFVRLNPNIATSSQFWELVEGREHEVLDVINANTLGQDARMGITKAILNANVKGLAEKIELCFKEEAIEALLDWINESPNHGYRLSSEWRYLLRTHPSITLSWLMHTSDPSGHTIYLIASLLDPNSTDVIKKGSRVWVNLAQKAGKELGKKALTETMAFLLTLGFNNPKEGADELVALSFEVVHDATANNELEYHSWQYLENHLPWLGWWRKWDKCERLRQGLVESYINYDWPISKFLETVRREETFKRIVEFCSTTIKGKKFLMQLLKTAQYSKNIVTEAQWTILQKIGSSKS